MLNSGMINSEILRSTMAKKLKEVKLEPINSNAVNSNTISDQREKTQVEAIKEESRIAKRHATHLERENTYLKEKIKELEGKINPHVSNRIHTLENYVETLEKSRADVQEELKLAKSNVADLERELTLASRDALVLSLRGENRNLKTHISKLKNIDKILH